MSQPLASAILVALVLTGCSTLAIDRAQDLADTGKQYVSTLKKVNDLALDKSIAFSAELLAHSQEPRTAELLARNTTELRERAALVALEAAELDKLQARFVEYESLAKGDPGESAAQTLGKFAGSLPSGLSLPGESVSGLGGLFTRHTRALTLTNALARDADAITQALARDEIVLKQQIDWIASREIRAREQDYADKVCAPFLNQPAGKEMGPDWKNAWSDYVRPPQILTLLAEARQTNQIMQRTWHEVLRDNFALDEIKAAIENLKARIATSTATRALR